jgi:SEC-C motif-containing protein
MPVGQTGRMRPDTPPVPLDDHARCPCGTGQAFGECCGPFLVGRTTAPTAVQLMRSRYTAFAVGDAGHLLATWHPSTRPRTLDLDPAIAWRSLDVVRTVRGGPLDRDGIVEFIARYVVDGERGAVRETSRFVRDDRWRYVDAVV